jgi:hypothetical protein
MGQADSLARQAARRLALMAQDAQAHSAHLLKAGGLGGGDKATLAAFDAPVLEHLRQCNMAAYEKMLGDITADINNVLAQS